MTKTTVGQKGLMVRQMVENAYSNLNFKSSSGNQISLVFVFFKHKLFWLPEEDFKHSSD